MCMPIRTCDLFFNLGSGSESDERYDTLLKLIKAQGIEVVKTWKIGPDTNFAKAHKELMNSRTPTAIVAGGDGTLSGVIDCFVNKEKSIVVVPAGTFNYFARNHKIPESLEGAVAGIANGQEERLNIGKLNEHFFLNNASFGLYPKALKKRESHYKKWGRGRLIASLSLISTLFGRHKLYRTTLMSEKGEVSQITPFVFVGINEFQLDEMGLRGLKCLERNQLSIYVTKPLGLPQKLFLTIKAALRMLKTAPEYKASCANSLRVELRNEKIKVAIDGEVRTLESPLDFETLVESVRIIKPSVS